MNITLTDNYKQTEEKLVVIPLNLIKSTFGISDEYSDVDFDASNNAIILSNKHEG